MERVTMQKRMAQEPAGVAKTTNKQRRTLLVCPGAMQNREGKLAVERRFVIMAAPSKRPGTVARPGRNRKSGISINRVH